MTKTEKNKNNLLDAVITEVEISCSVCKEKRQEYNTDEFSFIEYIVGLGWYATPSNIYCPKCNKKRTKK